MPQYTSILKSRPYLYLELKEAVNLIVQGFTIDDIKNKAVEENIFSVNTEARKKEIASTVVNRIKVLDGFLMDKIVRGSLQTSKQLALYSILKTDKLFFEFMLEVCKDKVLLNDMYLTDRDFNVFFRRKAEQSERIASWGDYTFYKLGQVYKRILTEAGFVKNSKKQLELLPQIIEIDVADHLKGMGDLAYLEAMLGVI